MKFGAELNARIHEPWRAFYLRYNELKQELKRRQLDHGWREQDELEFITQFETELERVFRFADDYVCQELTPRVAQCEELLQLDNRNDQGLFDSLAETLTEILFDVNDLARFQQVNLEGFEKMVKKHDQYTQLDLRTRYTTHMLVQWPLDKVQQQLDELVVRISHCNDICRSRGRHRRGTLRKDDNQEQQPQQQQEEAEEEQTAFERATAKYWVHPDNITEVKSIILFHLPVHVYNKKKCYEANDAAVSSVYYDNASFDLYTERLERTDGAEAIRFRWYGQETSNVYIERKTHHAPWLNGTSVKDRFRLQEQLVNSYAYGIYTADHLAADLRARGVDQKSIDKQYFVAHGIQRSILGRKLAPMCRVFYNRTAFQVPGDQRLRISLDCNLTFMREDSLDGKLRAGNHWRRTDAGIDYPFRSVDERDIHRFPYAVLETKIQSHLGQEVPAWLQTLLNSHLVHEVPRFSKYLHGASQLYRDRVPVLPWWLTELERDIRKPPLLGVGLSRSLSFRPLVNGHHRHSLLPRTSAENEEEKPYLSIHLPSSPPPANGDGGKKIELSESLLRFYPKALLEFRNKRSKEPNRNNGPGDLPTTTKQRVVPLKRAEPKTYFANERTFISWLQFCALLLTVALNLLNNGDHISRIIGAVFIIMASILCL